MDIRKLHEQLTEDIAETIRKFEKETGMMVSENIVRICRNSCTASRAHIVNHVDCNISVNYYWEQSE